MGYDITPIVNAGIVLIATIISVAVVPTVRRYLKQKLSKEELDGLEKAAEIAVKAAEQIYREMPKSGVEKKNYVMKYLEGQGYCIDTEAVNAMVEAKVIELCGAMKF